MSFIIRKEMKQRYSVYKDEVQDEEPRPHPSDLPLFLPYVTEKLQLAFDIDLEIIEESKDSVFSYTKHSTTASVKSLHTDVEKSASNQPAPKPKIKLQVGMNKSGEVMSLTLPKGQKAPRQFFRAIALTFPYQRHLKKLSIKSAKHMDGVFIYDLAKIVPQSFIVELILDDTPVFEANQSFILDFATSLQNISLDRCRLTDVGIKEIAAALTPPRPASTTLRVLSVASNAITDEGADFLAQMLRTNRTLLRLNLSGNRISDQGGEKFLSVFGMFEITPEEMYSVRTRHMQYLIECRRVYSEIYEQELAKFVPPPPKIRGSRLSKTNIHSKISRDLQVARAREATASTHATLKLKKYLGDFNDPYTETHVTVVGNKKFCFGNLTLCFLNLAYNNLRHNSMLKLIEVLQHQGNILLGDPSRGCGLLHVVVDGNDPFVSPAKLSKVSFLLGQALKRRPQGAKKRSERRESFSSRSRSLSKVKQKGRS